METNQPIKLKLKKVTLRNLDEAAMQFGVGGATYENQGTCAAGCSVTACGGSHNECCC
jgi:hypothetical protein